MRRFMQILVTYMLACLSAHAGSVVYKCQTDKGLVFQDVPCATIEKQVSAKDYYSPNVCGSSCSQGQLAGMGGQYGSSQQGNASSVAVVTPVEQAETAAGFQCSANGKTWISKSPCPATTTHYSPVSVSGFDQYGHSVDGVGTIATSVPVDQAALDHSSYCQSLRAHVQTAERPKGQDDVYERNKQAQLNGC